MENTERCDCGALVTIGRHTSRSRYTKKPICGGCTQGVATFLADADSRFAAERRLPKSREQLRAEVLNNPRLNPSPRANDDLERVAEASDVAARLAVHEAGHAVVAAQLGLPIAEARIDLPDGGRTRFVPDRTPADWTATNDAAVLLAGHFAELRWCAGTPSGSSFDEEAAHALVDRGGLDTPTAVAIVEDIFDRHAADVHLVADALIRQRHLTGEQIAEILARAAAEPGPARSQSAARNETRATSIVRGTRVHRSTNRRAGWTEYDPDYPPGGWDATETQMWNDMHRAGDADDWPLFSRLQRALIDHQDKRRAE